MEYNKIDTRINEIGIKEHKHDYYDWWHPATRVHSSQYMLEHSVGCAGNMWTNVIKNVEVLKKDMQFSLQEVIEARYISNRSYWVGEVLRLTTWGFVPKFKVEEQE